MYLTFHGKERFTVVEHHGHAHHDDHEHHMTIMAIMSRACWIMRRRNRRGW
jgi:hypothetical protein